MARRQYTVGILCPMWVELTAVIASFDEKFEEDFDKEHNITYYLGKLSNRYVVAVCLPVGSTGLEDAAVYAGRLESRYESLKNKTSLRFLVGIAGGNPDRTHDIRLGDVVIAERVVNYEKGKKEEGGFKPTSTPYDAPAVLLNGLNKFMQNKRDHGRLLMNQRDQMLTNYRKIYEPDDMTDQWTYPGKDRDVLFNADYSHEQPEDSDCHACSETNVISRTERNDTLPIVHTGLIASANSVLKDGYTRQHLKDYFKEILAVEMEASALKRYEYIVVRGICDYADTHKNDDWQPYASAMAAACCAVLIQALAPSAVPPGPPSPKPPPLADPDLESIFSAPSTKIRLYWENMEKKDNCFKETWTEARVDLYQNKADHYYENSRSLVISGTSSQDQKSRLLWIPPANVKVTLEKKTISLIFANCNGLGYKTPYKSRNGMMEYQARYNPAAPNIEVTVEFEDTSTVEHMSAVLLYSNGSIPQHKLVKTFPAGSMNSLTLCDLEGSETKDTSDMAIIMSNNSEAKEIDLSYLGKSIDFNLRTEGNQTNINLNLLRQPCYVCISQISSDWPPEKVKNNNEGKPQTIEIADTAESLNVDMKTPDAMALISAIVPDWDLKTQEFQVTFRSAKPKKGNFEEATLTIWSNKNACHVLVRIEKDEQKSVRWICSVLPCSSSDSSALSDGPDIELDDSELAVVIEHVEQHEGSALLRATMLPDRNPDQENRAVDERFTQCIKFRDIDDLDRFRAALEPCVEISPAELKTKLTIARTQSTIDDSRTTSLLRKFSQSFGRMAVD